MTTDNTREEVTARLAQHFVEKQDISQEAAITVAEKIAGADEDIWQAAVQWLENGEMEKEPTIVGYTPKSLNNKLSPSATFTALIALRQEPERAVHALKYSPKDLEKSAPK